jgi:hypothetical protein
VDTKMAERRNRAPKFFQQPIDLYRNATMATPPAAPIHPPHHNTNAQNYTTTARAVHRRPVSHPRSLPLWLQQLQSPEVVVLGDLLCCKLNRLWHMVVVVDWGGVVAAAVMEPLLLSGDRCHSHIKVRNATSQYKPRLQIPVAVPFAHGSESGWNPEQDPKFWKSGLGSGRFFFNLKATQLKLS